MMLKARAGMDKVLFLSFIDEPLAVKVGHCLGNFTQHTIWGFLAVNPIKISFCVRHFGPQALMGSLRVKSAAA